METNDEIWKDVIDLGGFYQISNLGRVRSVDKICRNGRGLLTKKGVIKKQRIGKLGYPVVTINFNKTIIKTVHRMLAIAFIPNPNNYPFINHINGDKTDNSLSNLEWCTAKQNINHALDMGLRSRSLKLTEDCVRRIRYLYECENYKRKILAKMFNISIENIYHIVNRKTWKHV